MEAEESLPDASDVLNDTFLLHYFIDIHSDKFAQLVDECPSVPTVDILL